MIKSYEGLLILFITIIPVLLVLFSILKKINPKYYIKTFYLWISNNFHLYITALVLLLLLIIHYFSMSFFGWLNPTLLTSQKNFIQLLICSTDIITLIILFVVVFNLYNFFEKIESIKD